eukprot:GEMP01092801.1.p1 GENE.GEMP01092801.1~~GEMP01092801.1.p1  ORF type:complete len:164 (+),score=32.49 GEMP01092801.1:36-527(+)
MSGKLVVPSDITILEEKHAVGKRRLRLFERIGLLGVAPMWHIRYTKNNTAEMKAVLTKRYDKDSQEPLIFLLKARQESIRKQVIAHMGLWAGIGTFGAYGIWSLRHYDYKAKAITLPFLMYGGAIIGRAVGDLIMNRTSEYARDRFLGQLPAHQFYKSPAAAE